MPHETAQSARRAVTYARQSKERGDKSAASPEAQRRAARSYVESQGWEHVEHFADLGRSGWDPKAPRPGLDAALASLENGRADVILVHRLDRLSRAGVVEAVALVRRIQAAGATFVSVKESFFDLSDEMGIAIFGIFAALAKQESDNISTRTLAAKAVLRGVGSHMSGRPVWGTRAVKVSRDGLTVRVVEPDPDTAPHLQEVVRRVLDGTSIRAEVERLNRAGLTPRPTEKSPEPRWTTGSLSRVLRSPSLAGYMPATRAGHVDEDGAALTARNVATPRDSRGRILIATDDDGHLMRPWTGPLEPAEWHRLQDVMDARPAVRGRSHEASLLGGQSREGGRRAQGLLRCAECGGPMVADRRTRKGPDGEPVAAGAYRCSWHRTGKTRGTCPGVSVSLPHTEAWLTAAVFSRAAALDPTDPDDLGLLAEVAARHGARTLDPGAAAERASLTAALDTTAATLERLDDDRAAGLFPGDLGASRYARQVAMLTARHEEATAALAALPTASLDVTPWLDSLGEDAPGAERHGWDAWDLTERREFLAVWVDRVEVVKGRHSGGRTPFRPEERFRVWWAGSTSPSIPAPLPPEPTE